ncbi:uncharacterized protein LOC103971540 isoform X2 [Musa acuminata AAA Group]|uniref:uncharacterized protein LOC103971540 isoform X2 n=1 Tax=Musa acuminata AAA Group TaxID=214697 RepID=UPI0031D86C93
MVVPPSSSVEDGPPPPPPCSICLEPIDQEAYLDRCFHAFCYRCISQWIRYVDSKHVQSVTSVKCPLCKIENFSIVHDFNGKSFQRHYVNQDFGKRHLSDAHDFRMKFYVSQIDHANDMFNVEQYWKRHKYFQKNIWIQDWLKREVQTLTQANKILYRTKMLTLSCITLMVLLRLSLEDNKGRITRPWLSKNAPSSGLCYLKLHDHFLLDTPRASSTS